MSRQQFNSRNDIGKVLTLQKSGATASFDPTINFTLPAISRRVSWKLDNGSETKLIAGNNITYTGFTSDNGIRTIEMRCSSLKNINNFNLINDNLYGNVDVSNLDGLRGTFTVRQNRGITGITHSPSSEIFTIYQVNECSLTGDLNIPFSGLGGLFYAHDNPNLTSITHVPSSQIFNTYWIYNSNITGNLNLPFSRLGGIIYLYGNTNLTGITHISSSEIITQYDVKNCNITGNLILPFSGLSGQFNAFNNPNLTGITHVPSSNIFTIYYANSCNLTGDLNLTSLSGLGGDFRVQSNSGLTSISHTVHTQNFNFYLANNCNLTGNLNLPFSGLGGNFRVNNNLNLTGITHTQSTQNFNVYWAFNCNLTGTHDISMLSNFGGTSGSTCVVGIYSNPNLTNIIFPTTTGFFRNIINSEPNGVFGLYSCNLDYVDFKPLLGATLISGTTQGPPRISLRDNGMSAADVNHILVDFSGNTTSNPSGWSNVNLNIGGTNADPDTSSGGYDGLAAISFLTGSPYNWTITY